MALAFERQAKESEKAFAAFSIYLSQGPERSLAKVAAKLSRSKVMMERWSRRWDWRGRLVAYAQHMATVEREATPIKMPINRWRPKGTRTRTPRRGAPSPEKSAGGR